VWERRVDPRGHSAGIKPMAYRQIVRCHVGSIASGIDFANAQPDQEGLASVNPIFTWLRLEQRIPRSIDID
jgi:multidrug resistance efflux pump